MRVIVGALARPLPSFETSTAGHGQLLGWNSIRIRATRAVAGRGKVCIDLGAEALELKDKYMTEKSSRDLTHVNSISQR